MGLCIRGSSVKVTREIPSGIGGGYYCLIERGIDKRGKILKRGICDRFLNW